MTTIKRAGKYIVSEYKQGGDIILDLENEQWVIIPRPISPETTSTTTKNDF